MVNLLKLYKQCSRYPLGKHLVSLAFCLKAPYFLTIRPLITLMDKGHVEMEIKQRWAIQNHIKTVHAIAVCNLVEAAMGICATVTIPNHLRWIPKGMDIHYEKKSAGRLTGICKVDPDTIFNLPSYPGNVDMPVQVVDDNGNVVTSATVRLWISENKKKSV